MSARNRWHRSSSSTIRPKAKSTRWSRRWGATRLFRGAWVIEFNSTADLARRALIAVGGAIACAIVEIKPNGDHAELGVEHAGRDALRRVAASVSGP